MATKTQIHMHSHNVCTLKYANHINTIYHRKPLNSRCCHLFLITLMFADLILFVFLLFAVFLVRFCSRLVVIVTFLLVVFATLSVKMIRAVLKGMLYNCAWTLLVCYLLCFNVGIFEDKHNQTLSTYLSRLSIYPTKH